MDKFFVECAGKSGQYRVGALLGDGLYSYVFPLDVLLVKSKRLALAPMYLGCLYARLVVCSRSILNSIGGMNLSHTWTRLSFICFYGRGSEPCPKPVEYKAVKPEKVIIDGAEKEKTSHYKPRGLRWYYVMPEEEGKALSKVVDVEKNYNFRPYSYTPHGVTPIIITLSRAERFRWCLEQTYHLSFTSCSP